MKSFVAAGIVIFVALVAGCQPESLAAEPSEAWVTIRDQRVAVEIADTPGKQALGLGNRKSLSWDHGMLFIYERPAFYSFWMKRMHFSIDIVWILNGRIVDIHANVPFVEGTNGPTVRPDSLVDRVLEVPAGYTAAKGWRVGDRVRIERPG